jgi:hypothetical protein
MYTVHAYKLGLARTIHIRVIHGLFGREITQYMVIYGIQFIYTVYIYGLYIRCIYTYTVYIYGVYIRIRCICTVYIYVYGVYIYGVYTRFWPTLI